MDNTNCNCRVHRAERIHLGKAINWKGMSARERDAVVAEKVMGWTGCDHTESWGRWKYGDPGNVWTEVEEAWCRGAGNTPANVRNRYPYPRFTTDIADAWEVVEEIAEEFSVHHLFEGEWYWEASVEVDWKTSHIAKPHSTASEAICIAALRAKGFEVQT